MSHRQACGESLAAYGNRMDSMWSYRWAYNEARKVKLSQDAYCAKAEAGLWDELRGQDYPESYQWEALVDVLRGRVKVRNVYWLITISRLKLPEISTHCYEEVDLDSMVRVCINLFDVLDAGSHAGFRIVLSSPTSSNSRLHLSTTRPRLGLYLTC